jgi:hypothetical protein
VGLIVHELVGNAVRYSDDQDLEPRIERDGVEIVIRVANTTSDDRADRLKARSAELTTLVACGSYTRALQHAAVLPLTERSEVDFEVHLGDLGQTIEIRVTNKAHPSRAAILEREFQRTRGDSKVAFARALQRSNRLPEGTTLLGLARIAMESAVGIEVRGDRVVITARIESSYGPSSRKSGL